MELVDGDTPMVRSLVCLLMWCQFLKLHRIEPGTLTIRVAMQEIANRNKKFKTNKILHAKKKELNAAAAAAAAEEQALVPGLFGCICQLLGAQSNQISD